MSKKAIEWAKDAGSNPLILVATCDLNGIWRGKRIPVTQVEKVLREGVRIPMSASCVDVWGTDLKDSPFLFKTGDSDGNGLSTEVGLLPDYSKEKNSSLIPIWLFDNQGLPSPIDPRHVLNRVCQSFTSLNLKPVVAFEMEFYLLGVQEDGRPNDFLAYSDKSLEPTNVLSITDLDSNKEFFDDLYRLCADFDIPMEAVSSENAPGQFEVNLRHVDNPLKAADHAVIFKRFIKLIAKRHDKKVTFMAKPFPKISGSGMHVHLSLLDEKGNNVFNNNTDFGSEILKNAVAGILEHMIGSTLIFAPNFNSYKRLMPGTHAPINICWGYENRTAAVRIPGGHNSAKRIEHRVAGADANPYLVLSSILASVLDGIKHKKRPFDPVYGDTYIGKLKQIPQSWDQAIQSFGDSKMNRNFYPEVFCEVFQNCKRQELETFNSRVEEYELATYFNSI